VSQVRKRLTRQPLRAGGEGAGAGAGAGAR
jgi:hypothetical protein